MEAWKAVASMPEFEGYTIVKAPVPEYHEESYQLSLKCCMDNKCGHYDTNWGCNPGAKMDVQRYYEDKDYVIIMYREFPIEDKKDEEAIKTISDDIHRRVRKMVLELRDNGVQCDGFVDGPCDYCGVCAYPEPCRFPEMKIPSVSTLGIGLRRYFDSIGISFAFEDGKVTLYGFIFVRK
jgi:predicted metal-binding protein